MLVISLSSTWVMISHFPLKGKKREQTRMEGSEEQDFKQKARSQACSLQ